MTEPTLSDRLKTFRTMVLANAFPPDIATANAQRPTRNGAASAAVLPVCGQAG